MNCVYSQIDTTYIQSYDSIYNYYIFKPDISITVSELISQSTSSFRLSNSDILHLERIRTDDLGLKKYKYSQYYNNVKVEDSQFHIQADNSNIPISANGELSYDISINTTPSISSSQAIDLAIDYANASKYFWEDTVYENTIKDITNNPDTSYYPSAELVIINLNASPKTLSPIYVLSYKIPIYSLTPFDSYYLYIDANSGNIISKRQIMKSCFNDKSISLHLNQSLVKIDSSKEQKLKCEETSSCAEPCNQGTGDILYYGSQYFYTDRFMYGLFDCTYRPKNTCTSTFLYVVKPNGNDYREHSNIWANSNDQPGVTALWCLERTQNFFRSPPYYRNSFDGNYSQVKLFAEKTWQMTDCEDKNIIHGQNAMWTGTHLEIGDGSNSGSCPYPFNNDLTTLDVIGHEFTHGVTDYEANLNYNGESGALNESFSDIFGTMVDFYGKTNYNTGLQPNYLLGEECTYSGMLRNMADPKSTNQPDTYGGTYWIDPTDINNDYGGVHTNSGVQNFWFYLLSEGGTDINDIGNQYCVNSIGRDKAAKIAYKALTEHLTTNSQYIDSRFFTIQSAKELFGDNSNEVAQVTQAWYAVGVGPAFIGTIEYNNLIVSNTQTISHNNEIVFNNLQVTPLGNLTVSSNIKITVNTNTSSKASNGSYFHAYIAPGCMGGVKINNSNNNNNYSDYNMDQEEVNKTDTNIVTNNNILLLTPNPNNGNMQVLYELPENETGILEIFDMFGKSILSYTLSGGINTLSIDASSLQEGIYLYRAIAGNKQIASNKIVVIK